MLCCTLRSSYADIVGLNERGLFCGVVVLWIKLAYSFFILFFLYVIDY